MQYSEIIQQGFEIHGSTGAPLPEKNNGWQNKNRKILEKKSFEKEKMGLRMLILFLNMT